MKKTHLNEVRITFILFNGNELFLAAHVRTESYGNVYAAVFVKVVLKECDEHSGRSNNCVVESVSKILAVFAVDSDFESACLSVTEV